MKNLNFAITGMIRNMKSFSENFGVQDAESVLSIDEDVVKNMSTNFLTRMVPCILMNVLLRKQSGDFQIVIVAKIYQTSAVVISHIWIMLPM